MPKSTPPFSLIPLYRSHRRRQVYHLSSYVGQRVVAVWPRRTVRCRSAPASPRPGMSAEPGLTTDGTSRRPTRLGVGRVAPGASGRGTAALDVDSGRALTAAGRESRVCSCGDAGSPSVAQAKFYRDTPLSAVPVATGLFSYVDYMVPAAVSVSMTDHEHVLHAHPLLPYPVPTVRSHAVSPKFQVPGVGPRTRSCGSSHQSYINHFPITSQSHALLIHSHFRSEVVVKPARQGHANGHADCTLLGHGHWLPLAIHVVGCACGAPEDCAPPTPHGAHEVDAEAAAEHREEHRAGVVEGGSLARNVTLGPVPRGGREHPRDIVDATERPRDRVRIFEDVGASEAGAHAARRASADGKHIASPGGIIRRRNCNRERRGRPHTIPICSAFSARIPLFRLARAVTLRKGHILAATQQAGGKVVAHFHAGAGAGSDGGVEAPEARPGSGVGR